MPTSSSNVSTTSRDWTNKCRTTKLQLTTIVVFFFGAFGFLISCIPYKNIDFQILRPAQIKLGPGYEKVEIHCEFCDNPEPIKLMDSLSRITARTSLNFIHSLKENLGKSPLFRDSSLYFINSEKLLAEIKRYKTRIKENTLIIILDSIALNDTVIEQRGKYSTNNFYTYGVIHKFGCKIYDKSSMVLMSNYLLEDTVFEPVQISPWPYTKEDFSFDNTAWNTGVLAGEKYAHYLAPHWIDQTRTFYYGNNKTFKKAYLLVQKQQLDSAINLLKKEADLKPGTSRSLKSLHNMAVTYELKDDLNNAHKMADSVYNASLTKTSKEYTEKLRIRKIDKIALDWQLTP